MTTTTTQPPTTQVFVPEHHYPRGYDLVVPADCVAARAPDDRRRAIENILSDAGPDDAEPHNAVLDDGVLDDALPERHRERGSMAVRRGTIDGCSSRSWA